MGNETAEHWKTALLKFISFRRGVFIRGDEVHKPTRILLCGFQPQCCHYSEHTFEPHLDAHLRTVHTRLVINVLSGLNVCFESTTPNSLSWVSKNLHLGHWIPYNCLHESLMDRMLLWVIAIISFFFHLRPVPRVEPIASEDNIGGEDDDEVIGMTNRMTLEDDKELRSVSSNLGRIPSFNNTPSNNNHVHITTSPISSSFAEVSLPTFDTRSGY